MHRRNKYRQLYNGADKKYQMLIQQQYYKFNNNPLTLNNYLFLYTCTKTFPLKTFLPSVGMAYIKWDCVIHAFNNSLYRFAN
jgi:hypothetical protein